MKTYPRARTLASMLLLAGGMCLAHAASAADVAGVMVAEHVSEGTQTLVLNGAGVRKRVVFDVYVAALYTTVKSEDASAIINSTQPRRLQLTLLRDIGSDALVQALNDGLADNTTPEELAALNAASSEFKTIMTSVGQGLKGDTIELNFTTTGVAVKFKDKALGEVKDPGFAAALMRVWLGAKPAQNSLKRALLGQK